MLGRIQYNILQIPVMDNMKYETIGFNMKYETIGFSASKSHPSGLELVM